MSSLGSEISVNLRFYDASRSVGGSSHGDILERMIRYDELQVPPLKEQKQSQHTKKKELSMAQQTWEVLPLDKRYHRAKFLSSCFEGHFCAIGLDDDIPSVVIHGFSDTDTNSITEEKFKLSGHSKPLTCLDSSRSYVISGSEDKTAILWNVSEGQIVQQFVSHSKPLKHVAVAEASVGVEDEILVATVTSNNMITIYNLDGTVKFSFKEPKHCNIRGICFVNYNWGAIESKDLLLILFGDNGMLKFVTRSGETRSVPIGTHSDICCAALSPDGSLLAIGTQSGVTLLFDMSNMEEILVLGSPDDKPCGVVSLGYNNSRYNMSIVYENRVMIYELEHKQIIAQWDLEGEGTYLRGQYSHDRFVTLSSKSKLAIRTLEPEF